MIIRVVVMEEEEEEAGVEETRGSREVHRQVLAYFKRTKKTFGPFDEFCFNGETGVEAYLKSRLGEHKYNNCDAKHFARAQRCRDVNAELHLMRDSEGNIASPASTFGIGCLHCDMIIPQAAGGLLDFSNFKPLLGYVNTVIKGVREDDAWRAHAKNKGINLDILREVIYMGAVPKGQCGVQYTIRSFSASLGFHVLTGKIMTAEELAEFKAAEGEEAFQCSSGRESSSGSSSSSSSSSSSGGGGGLGSSGGTGGGSAGGKGSGSSSGGGTGGGSGSGSSRSSAAVTNIKTAIAAVLGEQPLDDQLTVAQARLKVTQHLGHGVDKKHFKLLLREYLVVSAADAAAAKKVTADAIDAARHERLQQATTEIQRKIITCIGHPQLRTVPPHLMPLALCYVNREASEEHVLGRACAITENAIR